MALIILFYTNYEFGRVTNSSHRLGHIFPLRQRITEIKVPMFVKKKSPSSRVTIIMLNGKIIQLEHPLSEIIRTINVRISDCSKC